MVNLPKWVGCFGFHDFKWNKSSTHYYIGVVGLDLLLSEYIMKCSKTRPQCIHVSYRSEIHDWRVWPQKDQFFNKSPTLINKHLQKTYLNHYPAGTATDKPLPPVCSQATMNIYAVMTWPYTVGSDHF